MFWHRPVFMLALADMAVVVSALCLLLMGWSVMVHWGLPKVQRVQVYGVTENMESLKLEAILHRELTTSYLALSLPHLAAELATVSFVRRARITRSLPLSLDIYIESQVPVANWQRDDEATKDHAAPMMVNQQAEAFSLESDADANLPTLIFHPTGDVLQDRLFREALVQRLLTWQGWARGQHPAITAASWGNIASMRMTPGLMWEIEWAGGTRVNLGAWRARASNADSTNDDGQSLLREPIESLSLADLLILDKRMFRFLAAWPTLKKEYGNVPLEVDMRYPSGMAVRVRH